LREQFYVSILVLLEAVFQQGLKKPYYAFVFKIEQFFDTYFLAFSADLPVTHGYIRISGI